MNNKLKMKCKICGIFLCEKHQFAKKVEYYYIDIDHKKETQYFQVLQEL